MAETTATSDAPKVAPKAKFNKKAIMANRMAAVQNAGNMTPKMQRGFDRFAANINWENK